MKNGYIKVAAAAPKIRVADTDYNADLVIESIKSAAASGVKVITFPELTLTGVSCYDLYTHRVLLDAAKKALIKVVEATRDLDILAFVGLPFAAGTRLFSCAAAIYSGELLGLVPRENVDGTHFTVPEDEIVEVEINNEYLTDLGTDQLFTCSVMPELSVAVELGGDIDSIYAPSIRHAVAGATLVVQMAAFPATVTSTDEAMLDIRYRSKHLACGILLAAPGKGESSTDNVFSGLCMVAENGVILAQSEGDDSLAISEIDIEHLANIRRADGNFDIGTGDYEVCYWGEELEETALTRTYGMTPHVPADKAELDKYCARMIDMQVSALVKRMEYAHLDHCVVGISGGVDSTLAVMISALAVRRMGLPAENVVACTLPCFGTSSRTKSNAIVVAEQWGCEVRVIDIGKSVYQHFDDIGHAHDDYSIAFENAQARERTQVLMDIANKVNGLDVGTEDLSEFIDGWCTYNGDHTSMYDVNMGLTKTQVRAGVHYLAEQTEDKVLAAALWDVLDCPVTPELLPIENDTIIQKSEDSVGSYTLQDFFTHKMLICGFGPQKTIRLAKDTFAGIFTEEELIRWMTSYCKRLFNQQFKRSCLMDGPAVEAFSVSPRTGFQLPSDGESAIFLAELENMKK